MLRTWTDISAEECESSCGKGCGKVFEESCDGYWDIYGDGRVEGLVQKLEEGHFGNLDEVDRGRMVEW